MGLLNEDVKETLVNREPERGFTHVTQLGNIVTCAALQSTGCLEYPVKPLRHDPRRREMCVSNIQSKVALKQDFYCQHENIDV